MTEKRQLNIMVCVTSQRSCDKLIARGIERAGTGKQRAFLHVVHCVETGRNFMNTPYEADAIEYLFTAAQLAGADLSLVRADNVDDALVEYAEEHNVHIIVLGAGVPSGPNREPINLRLQRRLRGVEFDVVDAGG